MQEIRSDPMTGRRQRYLVGNKLEQASNHKVQATGWSRKYFACPFVFKQGSQGYYCLLCDCVIYGYTAFTNHVHGKRHTASVEQYGSDISSLQDDYYYCSRCDCVVPYYTNVFSHITGKRHQSLLFLDSKAIDWTSCDYFVCPFVSREGADKYYCLICGCYMFGHTAFQGHIHGKLHAIAVETFGRHISPLGDDYYFCSQCDCAIPHYKNVYDHVVGQRHQNSLHEVNEENNKNIDKEDELKEVKVDQRAASTEIQEFIKFGHFSRDSYKPVLGNQNFVFNINQQGNLKVCEDSSAREIFAQLQQSYENSNQNISYEFGETKNKIDRENDFLSEAEKPIILGRSYTILSRPVDKESKDTNKKNSCWKEISDKAETPIRLNMDSWQLSSCKNFLQCETAKYETKNSTCNNLNESTSNAILSDSNSIETATQTQSDTELCANSTNRLNEKSSRLEVDINGNEETLNDTPKNYQPQMRDIVALVLIDSRKIYCLVCDKIVEADDTNCVTHLIEADHCELRKKQLEDHTFFGIIPKGSKDLLFFILDEKLCNVNHALLNHTERKPHLQIRQEMHETAAKNVDLVKSQLPGDWYKIYRYWCVLCSANFDCEFNFFEHLKSTQHARVAKKRENSDEELIYDYCKSCSLLWFGYRNTYGNHCLNSSRHKLSLLQATYESLKLCESVKLLLNMPKLYIDTAMEYLDDTYDDDDKNIETLIGDLENAVKSLFPRASAHVYNFRSTGLDSSSRNIDVFLDCGKMRARKILYHQILAFIRIVHKRLSDDPLSWKIEELLICIRSHVIHAHHRETGLSCRISFDNGLAIESFKSLKRCMAFLPVARKLLLFLEQWLALCNLSGNEGITNFAIHWLVVFFLQNESKIAVGASMIAINKESSAIIACRRICRNYMELESENAFSVKELLARFFSFYAYFDYRYDVVCPATGEAVKKQELAESFRIDAMCVQDPYNLQENLTKNVSKIYLSHFRNCCSKSFYQLRVS